MISFNITIEIASGSHDSEVKGTDCHETRNEDNYVKFTVKLNYSIAVDTQLLCCYRKQQMFTANGVAEVLDTTDVSQWKHVSGTKNPADIGTREINVEELKRRREVSGSLCRIG